MTKQSLFEYCLSTHSTSPDYPFEGDFETAVFRHSGSRKWYAIVMRVSRRKFGFDSDVTPIIQTNYIPLDINAKIYYLFSGYYELVAKNNENEITLELRHKYIIEQPDEDNYVQIKIAETSEELIEKILQIGEMIYK
jgi:predicted DNA-binding protein (MmcQ/YjbR family)